MKIQGNNIATRAIVIAKLNFFVYSQFNATYASQHNPPKEKTHPQETIHPQKTTHMQLTELHAISAAERLSTTSATDK